jgi:hypothetical protein
VALVHDYDMGAAGRGLTFNQYATVLFCPTSALVISELGTQ